MVELNNIDFGSSVDNVRAPISISKEIMPRSFKVCSAASEENAYVASSVKISFHF